ncbi:unnamed protein product [Symbiodinium sp. CCMP2456]|nr:unnamed protein product [Symbiodinium sp. CCMP2456]
MRAALAERARRAASGAASALRAKGHPSSELEKVLRRVTHADCAAIPAEDLEAAVRWAKRSEDALAKSLKHIQELDFESHDMKTHDFTPEASS